MQELLIIIDKKLKDLYNMRPFSGSEMKKIRDIFRLEYNYNSNHIEWNSLTMQETRSLLFLEIDNSSTKAVTEKRKRDEKEMIWHDNAIQQLWFLDKLDFTEGEIKSDLKITHKLIRELNKIILIENYKKRVIDHNWDQFFVDVIVWQYKSKNNHVKRRDWSIFHFAETSETQALMQDLIDWFEKNKNSLHPIVLATIFHYKFIRIHPFDDWNGRVCRLLVNMILMHFWYPLFITPTAQKEEYYDILEYMDWQFDDIYSVIQSTSTEEYSEFVKYVANRVLWSIQQMIDIRKKWNMRKKLFLLIIVWLLGIGSFFVYNKIEYNTTQEQVMINANSWDINSNNIENIVFDKNFSLQENNCNFINTGEYKFVDLYEKPFITPQQVPTIQQYTKNITISWNIEDVKICILSDVREDHKIDWYAFTVKTYLWSIENAWYINVWRYGPNKQLYDKDSPNARNNDLYGKFLWSETPFKQVLGLERVIVADTIGDSLYSYIRPINLFQKNWTIKVWWYVEWDSHFYAWKILQFRIIYKWSGTITKLE